MDPVQKAVINHTFGMPLIKTKRPVISCNVCQIRFNSEVQNASAVPSGSSPFCTCTVYNMHVFFFLLLFFFFMWWRTTSHFPSFGHKGSCCLDRTVLGYDLFGILFRVQRSRTQHLLNLLLFFFSGFLWNSFEFAQPVKQWSSVMCHSGF